MQINSYLLLTIYLLIYLILTIINYQLIINNN